ncbi:hypothetical protein [Ruegeria sp.]|uniref:class I adenylate-forming enzyme family protein n=1 Tax=Ruegeria sp. TaxID=1879320 RepID=UPI0023146C93|nr:AMP-binding protein [Ruegeria sp.]
MLHGEVGELMVRVPIVMMGYYNDLERTAEALEDDVWLHTADLAKMDSDGCIYVVDRKKDMILTAGYNVYPAEIERVLTTRPAVAISAAGPVPDDPKGEIAKAYIVLKEGVQAEADEVIAFGRETLAAYKFCVPCSLWAICPKPVPAKPCAVNSRHWMNKRHILSPDNLFMDVNRVRGE